MKLDKFNAKEIEIHRHTEQKQEFKYAGSMRMIPGLKLYAFNWDVMTIEEVKIKKEVSLDISKNKEIEKNKVFNDPKCIYYQALNYKNAVRHANRIIEERSGIKKYFLYENGKLLKKVL